LQQQQVYLPLQARQWQKNVLLARDLALALSTALSAKVLAGRVVLNVLFAMARVSQNAVRAMARAKYNAGSFPYNVCKLISTCLTEYGEPPATTKNS
jgi:hypothetical protein